MPTRDSFLSRFSNGDLGFSGSPGGMSSSGWDNYNRNSASIFNQFMQDALVRGQAMGLTGEALRNWASMQAQVSMNQWGAQQHNSMSQVSGFGPLDSVLQFYQDHPLESMALLAGGVSGASALAGAGTGGLGGSGFVGDLPTTFDVGGTSIFTDAAGTAGTAGVEGLNEGSLDFLNQDLAKLADTSALDLSLPADALSTTPGMELDGLDYLNEDLSRLADTSNIDTTLPTGTLDTFNPTTFDWTKLTSSGLPTSLIDLFKNLTTAGLVNWGSNEMMNDFTDLMDKAIEWGDPFHDERPFYQDELQKMYTDPNYFRNNATFAGLRDQAVDVSAERSAAWGNNLSGSQLRDMTRAANNAEWGYVLPYMQLTGTAAGMNANPGNASSAITSMVPFLTAMGSGQYGAGSNALGAIFDYVSKNPYQNNSSWYDGFNNWGNTTYGDSTWTDFLTPA